MKKGRVVQPGFTLIEAVISMVVVAVMLMAALNTLAGTARAKKVNAAMQLGPALAQGLMSEILQGGFEEFLASGTFGRETGESGTIRVAYDDVDDYIDWNASPPQDMSGTVIPNTTGWTREVSVEHVTVIDPSIVSGTYTGLKRITVTVTDPQGRVTTLVALRSESGTYDQIPLTDTTIISAVQIGLQVGSDTGSKVTSGTQLLNWPTPPP